VESRVNLVESRVNLVVFSPQLETRTIFLFIQSFLMEIKGF